MIQTTTLPPGPRGLLPLREIRLLRRDIASFLTHMGTTYGDLSCIRVGPHFVYLLCHPELLHEALVTRHESLHRTWVFGKAENALGQGMLTSEGDFHRRQRKIIQPALRKERVCHYAEAMIRIADRAARELPEATQIDMAETMTRLTLSVVAQALFSSDIVDEADELGRTITQLTKIFRRIKSPYGPFLNRIPFLPLNRRFNKALKKFDDTIYRIIAHRRDSGEERNDLLSMLLVAPDDEGATMPDSVVRDEAFAVLLAGHETTGITLTWAWYALSQHPEFEEEFHRELDEVLGGRLPGPDDLERLPFTRKIVAETTRLYPAFYLNARRAVKPCTLGGYAIRPGALVFLSIFNVHRDARFFPDPERFDPHRWTPEMKELLPRYAYCAFGGGPHACLGEGFAWSEAMLVLAILGQRWKARVVPGHKVGLDPLVNLRPLGGMPMTLVRR